jgi:hypothetical protein
VCAKGNDNEEFESMNDVERLLAIEEIKQVKARYFRLMDTKDWEGFATVFATDANVDYAPDQPAARELKATGASNVLALVRWIVGKAVTIHHGHMAEVEVVSATSAKAIVAMEDLIFWPEGLPNRTLHGWGHYHETYEKIGGKWLIKSLKLTRIKVEMDTL